MQTIFSHFIQLQNYSILYAPALPSTGSLQTSLTSSPSLSIICQFFWSFCSYDSFFPFPPPHPLTILHVLCRCCPNNAHSLPHSKNSCLPRTRLFKDLFPLYLISGKVLYFHARIYTYNLTSQQSLYSHTKPCTSLFRS